MEPALAPNRGCAIIVGQGGLVHFGLGALCGALATAGITVRFGSGEIAGTNLAERVTRDALCAVDCWLSGAEDNGA